MKLNKLFLAVALAGALGAGSASATLLTLNPSAPNGGAACVDLHGGQCGPVGTNAPFQTDNAHIAFTGIVDIAQGAGSAGTLSTFTEAGNFSISSFDNQTLPPGSQELSALLTGINRSQGGNYEIYGTFTGNGSGVWVTGFNFITTSIALTMSIYAAPNGGSAPVYGNPGVTPGNEDFLLGTASIVLSSANLGTASISANNVASQSLDALLQFTPANPALVGVGGFFQAPLPFNLTLGSHAGGNALATTWSPLGVSGVEIRTADQRGGGDIAFAVPPPQQVAEPTPLALMGLGLVALGFVGYGSRSRSRS